MFPCRHMGSHGSKSHRKCGCDPSGEVHQMKRALLRGASAATMVIVGGLWASQALAQAVAAPPAAAAAAPDTSGEVIVTAQRRNQAIEHVPVAVSAFTAKQRQVLGITTTQQLSDFTPGLSYFASNDRAYIRGIGRNTAACSSTRSKSTADRRTPCTARTPTAARSTTSRPGQPTRFLPKPASAA